MENSVICPKCESSSLSSNKNDNNDVEITCFYCGTTFKPGEGYTAYSIQKPAMITVVALGYICVVLSLIILPIIFLPLAVIFGLCCIVDGKWRIVHGIIIIGLSILVAKWLWALILAVIARYTS